MNWIIGIKWSKFPRSDCSSLTIGSKGNELLSQLCSHSPELSPKSQWNSHILSGMTAVFLLRKLQTIRSTFLSTTPSIPVFHSLFFLASCFKRTSCPFRRLSFHLAVNPLGFCLLSVLFFLHHQYHHSVPLHRRKESWVPEKSSNWNQHWMTASLSSLLSKLESLF